MIACLFHDALLMVKSWDGMESESCKRLASERESGVGVRSQETNLNQQGSREREDQNQSRR